MSTPETELDVSTKSNENISVKVSKQPNSLVKFEISVVPQAVVAAYQKALKNINKEVSIPGFRKGKAPDNLIIERYQAQLQKEWVDIVLNTGFNEALQLTHIHPLRDGNLKRPVVQECSQEKGARFTIEFEARPNIPSIDPAELQLKKVEPKAITQEQKDQALNQVIYQFTTYDEVHDRPVQEGDYIDVDVEILENPPRRIVDNQRVRVAEKDMPAWLRSKVIGLKEKESVEGETEPQEEADGQKKTYPFKATVEAIWQGNLPAVDDELAKKVGLQTIDELHQKIQERLEKENQLQADEIKQQALELFLIEHYPIDLPTSMVEADKQARLKHYTEQLKRQHQENYLRENRSRIETAMEESTKRSLQLYFLLRKIAADHQIDVTDEEMNQELNRQLSLIPSGRSQLDIYNKDQLREQIHSLALEHKIKEFLLSKATYT